MPNIKSAKKRVKVIQTKTLRNRVLISSLRTHIKKANIAIAENSSNKLDAVKAAIKKIDMAESKGLLHKNNAARKKSAIMHKLNASV